MNMNKRIKSTLSIVLALAVIISMMPMTVFAGTLRGQKDYLYIGDSMTYNFVNGRHQYTTELLENGHYPALAAKAMRYHILNDKEDKGDALTSGGIRSTDVYCLLSDFEGDSYTQSEYKGFFAAGSNDKDDSQQLVKDANVISIQLGHSNTTVYGLARIISTLGVGYFAGDQGEKYNNTIDDIFTKEEIARTKPLAQRCIQKIALCAGSDKSWKKLLKPVGDITDTVLYMLMSAMVHFDKTIECIKKLNPDAKIFVVGLENTAPDLKLEYTIGKKTLSLSLRKIAQPLFDILNEYYRVYSEYSNQYYYVAPIKGNQSVSYFDVIAKGDRNSYKVMNEMLRAYFSATAKYTDPDSNVVSRAKALTPIALEIAKKKTINVNEMLNSAKSLTTITDVLGNKEEAYDYLMKTFASNPQGLKEFDYIVGQAWLLRMFNGVMVHPASATHRATAENLISAMRHPRVNRDAIKYHIADRLMTCAKQRKK